MDEATYAELLYRAAMRTRTTDLDRLAGMVHGEVPRVASALERLRAAGLLGFDGRRITYLPPPEATAGLILRALEEQLEQTRSLLDTAARLTDEFAQSLHVAVGSGMAGDTIPIDVFEGPLARQEALHALVGRAGDDELMGVLPIPGELEAETLASRLPGAPVRVLVPRRRAADNAHPLQHLTSVQARSLTRPPSWFWVCPRAGLSLLPLGWGDHRPTKIILVSAVPATRMLQTLFESLWRTGQPSSGSAPEELWVPLLRLMRAGIPLDDAATALGINPRTARRRLEAGLDHYGVETLFGLAAAWAAELVGGELPESPVGRR